MRKYLAPIAICLALGLGLAGAQTINKAIQLSPDTTGSWQVDTFLGTYFPGHILSPTGGARAAPTVTGTGTPTISGTDTAATVTMGTSATTATVLFGTAYGAVPHCVVTSEPTGQASPIAYTPVTTSIAITQNSTSGNKIDYVCMSAS